MKTIHSQVPAFDGRWTIANKREREATMTEAPNGLGANWDDPSRAPTPSAGSLGAVRFQFTSWTPVKEGARIPEVAMQIVLAEKDEAVDNESNGQRAYDLARGPKNLVTIPDIKHYGIYRDPDARFRCRALAIAWSINT